MRTLLELTATRDLGRDINQNQPPKLQVDLPCRAIWSAWQTESMSNRFEALRPDKDEGLESRCDREELRDVVTTEDCREKPVSCPIGSCEESSEKVTLPIPCPKSFRVPLGLTAPAASL